MGNTSSTIMKPVQTHISEKATDERALLVSKFVRDVIKQYKTLTIPIEIQKIIYKFCDRLLNIEYPPFKIQPDIEEYEVMKMLITGAHGWFNSGVGKSCLLLRYVDNAFTDSYISTLGVDFRSQNIKVNAKHIRLQIWDVSPGRERFRPISSSYYRGAHAIMILFDISDRETFDSVRNQIVQTEKHSSENHCKILVGNKLDLSDKRVVSFDEADAIAKEYNMKYIEVSAKTGENVNGAFEMLVTEVFTQKVPLWKRPKKSNENNSSGLKMIATNKNSNENACVVL